MTIETLFSILTAVGAVATILSLVWAIRVYWITNENAGIAEIRKHLLAFPEYCKEIGRLLSEPVFSAIGCGIAEELEKLMPDNQSIEDFTNDFMLNSDNDNYKALAIYLGMKKCPEIDEISKIISQIEDCRRNIVSKFPVLGMVYSDLAFYITFPAERSVTAGVLNKNLKCIVDDEENEGLKNMLNQAMEVSSKELYFKSIALHLTMAIGANFKENSYGQASITLATKMLRTISKKFEILDNKQIKKIAKLDQKNADKIDNIVKSNEYSVQVGMELLKIHKKIFNESEWDALIEYKGGILQLMKD